MKWYTTDLMRWLPGDPLSVVAQMGRSPMDTPVEDHGVAIYRYPGGVTCAHESSWVDLAAEPTLEVYGTEAVLVHTYTDCATTRNPAEAETVPPLRIWRRSERERGWQPIRLPVTYSRYHHRVAKIFFQALADGRAPPISGEDGRAALALILAAYESDRTGQIISLSRPH